MKDLFQAVALGVVFDPKTRKVLIGKEGNNWNFLESNLSHGTDLDKILKSNIKKKTGFEIKNLGTIFSGTDEAKEDLLEIFFLCEVFKGKENPGNNIKELKWVKPDDIEKYLQNKLPSRLKEYIMNLSWKKI